MAKKRKKPTPRENRQTQRQQMLSDFLIICGDVYNKKVAPLPLIPGVESDTPSKEEITMRVRMLASTVIKYAPEMLNAIKQALEKQTDDGTPPKIMVHQDGFAINYDVDEYTILGAAIKLAGMCGVGFIITGRNGDTCMGIKS